MNENEEHRTLLGDSQENEKINQLKNKLKKILDYLGLKEYFKIIYHEINNNFKNIVFLITGCILICRILYFLYNEGYYTWYNIAYKYNSYFDEVVIRIIHFLVIGTFLVSCNAFLKNFLEKYDKKKALSIFCTVIFVITAIAFIISVYSSFSFYHKKFILNIENILKIIVCIVVLSGGVSLFFVYSLSYIIFPDQNQNHSMENNKRKRIWPMLIILSFPFVVAYMCGIIKASTQKSFKLITDSDKIFAVIYEDKDNYIVEPIENGGIINIFIQKEISKKGIVSYYANNVKEDCKDIKKIIKILDQYNKK